MILPFFLQQLYFERGSTEVGLEEKRVLDIQLVAEQELNAYIVNCVFRE